MRSKTILLTIIFSLILFNCSSDESQSLSDNTDNADNIIQLENDSSGPKGRMKLKIYNEIDKSTIYRNNDFETRTTLPDVDMTTDTFKISGSCSDGSSFNLLTALDEIEIRNMSLGRWIIKIEALNTDKTGIGYGEGSIEIFEREEEEPFELDILVSPHAGFGAIQITVEWDAELDNPSIEGRIARSNSTVFDLQFEIIGNTATAEITGAAGYYLLSVNLYDATGDVHPYVGGAVEVVRIVVDEITPGVFYINANSEYGYGDIEIGVDVDMKDPIDIALSGQVASYNIGSTMTVTASSLAETDPVTYTWYLNGELVKTDYISEPATNNSTFTTNSTLPAGPYRLDITAFNDSGDRAGSVNYHFQVLSSPPSNLSYSENPAVYTVGIPIINNIATVTGEGCTFIIDNALPDGLTLDVNTGVISGKPLAAQPETVYTVYANNFGGSTSYKLTITVNDEIPEPETAFPPITFETGDTSQFNAVTGSGLSVQSSIVAKGSYALQVTGTGAENYGRMVLDSLTTFRTKLLVYIPSSTFTLNQYISRSFVRIIDNTYSGGYIGVYRSASGSGSPDRWRLWINGTSYTTTANFSFDEWHTIELEVTCNGSTAVSGKWYVDGTLLYNAPQKLDRKLIIL